MLEWSIHSKATKRMVHLVDHTTTFALVVLVLSGGNFWCDYWNGWAWMIIVLCICWNDAQFLDASNWIASLHDYFPFIVVQMIFFLWFALSGWLFRCLILATWILPFAGPLLIGTVANNLVIKVLLVPPEILKLYLSLAGLSVILKESCIRNCGDDINGCMFHQSNSYGSIKYYFIWVMAWLNCIYLALLHLPVLTLTGQGACYVIVLMVTDCESERLNDFSLFLELCW